jgi:hypothetical protein
MVFIHHQHAARSVLAIVFPLDGPISAEVRRESEAIG